MVQVYNRDETEYIIKCLALDADDIFILSFIIKWMSSCFVSFVSLSFPYLSIVHIDGFGALICFCFALCFYVFFFVFVFYFVELDLGFFYSIYIFCCLFVFFT